MNLEEHHIYFQNSSLEELFLIFRNNTYSKSAILVDENTFHHCYPYLRQIPLHSLIKIQSGEERKNLQTCTDIWQHLTDEEFDRKGIVINLGGGVIGDMGGFCASTYKRGIAFIQIPTTLLSMVDASIGGKLGIDFNGFKNHIGVFKEPLGVYIFPEFLKTLDERELRSGFAEIIKHCLIRDKSKWAEIQKISIKNINDKDFDWSGLIRHSIEIKAAVVMEDPTEKGLRKILNFGHTLGHAVETYFLGIPEKKLLHGEAIAIGMICEAWLSYHYTLISSIELDELTNYLIKIFGKTNIADSDLAYILPLTMQDKKNSHGKVKFSLLKAIGDCGFDFEVSFEDMRLALNYYTNLP